jgi:shikimate dehydrogenase
MRRLLAVLGQDVSKSLSPVLHRAAADRAGLDIAYVPISCRDAGHFDRVVDALAVVDALGANVTIPYKTRALERSSVVGPEAEAIGAVNTLTFRTDGTIRGDNTDGPGMIDVLRRAPGIEEASVQILGAGGVARAVAWALRAMGITDFTVCARRLEQAEALVSAFGGRSAPLAPVEGATLVVSTLPGTPELAERASTEWIAHTPEPLVLDLAYGGPERESALTERARGLGWDA